MEMNVGSGTQATKNTTATTAAYNITSVEHLTTLMAACWDRAWKAEQDLHHAETAMARLEADAVAQGYSVGDALAPLMRAAIT